jgi:Holliday junction resolvase
LNGSIYERELAGILSGNRKVIEKFSKKMDETSRLVLSSMVENPFYVSRTAGSFGADLVAMRHDLSLIIEVKSSIGDTLSFAEASGQRQDQAIRLQELCGRAGLFVTYAYRLKSVAGDPWMLFAIDSQPHGSARIIFERLPKVGITKKGNFQLKWSEGFPLVRFISYINQKI